MVKKLLTISVAVLVVLMLVPVWVGFNTRTRFERQMADLSPEAGVRLQLDSYRQGWVRSEVKLRVALDPTQLNRMTQGRNLSPAVRERLARKLPLQVEIAHGPIATMNGVGFCWAQFRVNVENKEPWATIFEDIHSSEERMTLLGSVSYIGETTVELAVPEINFSENEAVWNISPWQGTLAFIEPRMRMGVLIESLQVRNETVTTTLRDISFEMHSEKTTSRFGVGDSAFSIGGIEVDRRVYPAAKLADIEGMAMTSHIELGDRDDLLDIEGSYSIDRMVVGPDVEFDDMLMQIDFRNFDPLAFKTFSERLQEIQSRPDTVKAEVPLMITPEVNRVLVASPVIRIAPVRFNLNDEPFEAEIEAQFNPVSDPNDLTADLPQFWTQAVEVGARFSFSRPLATRMADQILTKQLKKPATEEQVAGFLANFSDQGVLIEDDDGYRSKIDFDADGLRVNGNPFPPSER